MLKNALWIVFLFLFLIGCSQRYTPRPRGYFRVDFPKKEYVMFDSVCPYKFMFPKYSIIESDPGDNKGNCFINVGFPVFNAKIHISYLPVDSNLGLLLEDAHTFAYKHVQVADGIERELVSFPEKKVYGIIYHIKGNVATANQFFLTDSTDHYLRGALYFNERPNKDSIAPVLDFIKEDIYKLVESFEWKY